ncbi:MAG: DegT/DnrJ/EryC1/StrS family aminotransferase [Acidobacteria bacterium]|nr:DegT/DnrJ/EryC1/StrS family aminotransferase [Acidobacteriota bacterium]
MRSTFLPYHLPSIDDGEIAAVVETMKSGWLTTGPRVREFEAQFATAVGAEHAVAVNSCTAAMHLGLEAAGVRAGDEVIVPTLTFTATAEVAIYLGAKPVLVDVQRDTYNLDPDAVARAITPRTRAILPVHYAGQACDMTEILELARRHGLRVIEDAAHAMPASYRGTPVGRLGDVTCFSFYATKTLTTGEGGMVTTQDAALAARMRMMSLHGISKDAWKRYTAEGSWYYEVLEAGFKYNMTDVAAALGLAQLGRQQEFLARRRAIAQQYDAAFADLPGVAVPRLRADREHAWHLYVIEIDPAAVPGGRNGVIDALRHANIGTSVHFIPLHLHPYYRDRFGYVAEAFPTAMAIYERIMSLPIYPAMTDGDVQDVIDAVRRAAGGVRTVVPAAAGTI